MIGNPLLGVGLLLIAGYWGGRAANALKLPRVTGYLVAGMVLSPSFTNILSRRLINHDLAIITEIALGVISYSIGGSLILKRLKRLGGTIAWVTLLQAAGSFFLTTAILIPLIPFLSGLRGPEYGFLSTYLPMALVIGAISVATAPGAILAIVNELKAAGSFTSILLGVIALGDGVAIVNFSLTAAAVHVLINPDVAHWPTMVARAWGDIGFSLVLGFSAGVALMLMARLVRRREAVLMVILGILFCTGGAAIVLGLSPLLASMAMGFTLVNLEKRHHILFTAVEQIEEPLYGLFFGLAGAHIDLGVLESTGLLAGVIAVVRMGGKQLGAWSGAVISHAPQTVRKYLGVGLFPKAGVAIGLVLIAQEMFSDPLITSILLNAIIGSVIINELVAPPLVKWAIHKAGEIPKPEMNV